MKVEKLLVSIKILSPDGVSALVQWLYTCIKLFNLKRLLLNRFINFHQISHGAFCRMGIDSLATRPIYKYVCHFFFFTFFFFSFIFYFLIQCLASLWVNFSSVVVSEIY